MFKITLTRKDNSKKAYLCDSYHLYRKGYFINLFEEIGNKTRLRRCINLVPDYKHIEVVEIKKVIEIKKVEEFVI